MASLRPNLVKRIDRPPKPTSVAAAMQPLFEAVSNAIHSVQSKFEGAVTTEGRVVVTVNTNRKKEGVCPMAVPIGPTAASCSIARAISTTSRANARFHPFRTS